MDQQRTAMRHVQRFITLAVLAAGCGATPPTAPDAGPDANQPLPTTPGSVGSFTGAGGHRGEGSVTLTVEGQRARLEFGSNFSVSEVPGPFVYLNTTNDPNTGAPLRVSELQRNAGSQIYTFLVPAGVRYTWVLVWCDPFNVPVAEAPIPPTP